MSTLYLKIEAAETALRALRDTGACNASALESLATWFDENAGKKGSASGSGLWSVLDNMGIQSSDRVAQMARVASVVECAGIAPVDESELEFALSVLEEWSRYQSAHA